MGRRNTCTFVDVVSELSFRHNLRCSCDWNGFYPTILDFAGLSFQPQQHKDGVSLLPVVNAGRVSERALYWHHPHYGNQGGEPFSIIRRGDWKLIYYYEDLRCELYDLAMDVEESEPLNIQYPEKVKGLKTLLDA